MDQTAKPLTIIYFADYWETERCRRRQQLAIRLGRRPEVEKLLYVELPVSLGEFIKAVAGVGYGAAARWRRLLRHGQRFSMGKIELITPICLSSYFRFAAPPDKALVHWQEIFLIRKMLKECESKRLMLWISHPFATRHVGQFGELLVCYDCTEDFGGFVEWGEGIRKMARENDHMLSRRADLVFVQTPAHLEKKRWFNSRVFLVPNAADLELFNPLERESQIPAEFKKLPRPILGYVGDYKCQIDGRLLIKVAQAYPDGSLVVVGGVRGDADAKEVGTLKKMPNVSFLGEKPYQQVPNYIEDFPPMPGGVGTFLHNLCKHSQAEFNILATEVEEYRITNEFDRRQPFSISRIRLPAHFGFLALLINVYRQVATFQPDVIFWGHSPWAAVAGRWLKALFHIPLAILVHSTEMNMSLHGGFLSRRLVISALRGADLVFVNSRHTRQSIERLGVAVERMWLLNPGVDVKQFSPDVDASDLEQLYGLERKRVLLTVSRLVAKKTTLPYCALC